MEKRVGEAQARHFRGWRTVLVVLPVFVLAALAVLFTVRRDPEPTTALLAAEQYLNLAREYRVDLDAPASFEKAVAKLREARLAMDRQYSRPPFIRSYDETSKILIEARRLITVALAEARDTVAARQEAVWGEIRQVRAEAAEIRLLLRNLPPQYQDALRHVVSAESRTWAAEARATSKGSRDAIDNMRMARSDLNLALREIRGLLLDFLERRADWSTDIRETVAWSRSGQRRALVVDKLNHRVHLLQGGRTVRTYPAELGPGWIDRKVREGDRATPEGRYRVVRKKSAGQTRYHKALLLDYPNGEDAARFRRLVRAGMLPRGSRIGGLIEIHGEGGKGEDWTMGCVSLRNDHIDEVFSQLAVGTPVTIVGLWEAPEWLSRFLETADR